MRAGAPVGVIGGGLAGLAAAIVLAARGHPVTLLEKNGWLGGKAALLSAEGFRFDMGPTILTLPGVLARVFAEAGHRMEDELDLIRLDPQWRCLFADGSVLDLVENGPAMAQRLDAFAPSSGAGEGYLRFQKLSQRLHEISERFFFWKPVEDLRDTLDLRSSLNARTLADVLSLRMGSTVAGTIRGHVADRRVAQMLDHFVQYVGSSPFGAPAVLCAIAHMQTDGGVWYPRGERLPVGAVVSNMDAVRTYRELVGGEAGRRFARGRRHEPACSGVVLYLGLERGYDHLLHHNFVFSADAEEEFDWIYRKGEPAPDPTCYLAAPARTDPAVAPQGGEALYVLVHTPYLRPHHDWQSLYPAYRRVILDKLARTAGLDDLERRIRFEACLTPQDIHERYRVLDGAIYGLASHGRFLGAFKPGNRSRSVPGLYLAGGAAHPGPGMPMVLMSGWIAADALDRDAARTSRAA